MISGVTGMCYADKETRGTDEQFESARLDRLADRFIAMLALMSMLMESGT